jgi:AraC-like DNA-binding protein
MSKQLTGADVFVDHAGHATGQAAVSERGAMEIAAIKTVEPGVTSMEHAPAIRMTQASTLQLPLSEQLDYWDDYNARTLVGFRCSSLSDIGLNATQTNYTLPRLGIADIRGNEHSVERGPALTRQFPKHSVFACCLVEGKGYFVQSGQCIAVSAGETIVYDTHKPYVFGFMSTARQLLIDLPTDRFASCAGGGSGHLPLLLPALTGVESMLGATLRATILQFLAEPSGCTAPAFEERVQALLGSMLRCRLHGASHSVSSMSYVLTIKQHIANHLGDARLTPDSIAKAVGVSVRHMNRMLAADDTSLSAYIWSQRIGKARADLIDPRLRHCSTGDIAFRWGFSSQSHFSRVIHRRFGVTPTELRRERGLQRAAV